MSLHKFSHAKELMSVAEKLHVDLDLLIGKDANKYINFILNKYSPWKKEGHLSISDNAERLSTDEKEFSFSLTMKNEPAFIFFEQNHINKDNVLCVHDARKISILMESSYGMEYFISDKNGTYLISVNWYSIEFTGNISLV